MSIFKTKLWWSNETLQEDKESRGFQNSNCLIVDRFASHSDSDCIIVCEGPNLKIYKPDVSSHQSSQVVLEKEMDNFILHIATGKFIINSEDLQIVSLHTDCYAIYALERRQGHIEVGEQYLFSEILTHKLPRKAHSLTSGHFGNIKSRELVCVQGLDGSLSFFDQDIFLFVCLLKDIIIPGPISYISGYDCFVICKSTWILEIYSFQQLRDFSEAGVRQGQKNIPQWCYNAGEEISSVQVIQTSNNFSSIIALGERYLYCFQDNGLMKFMKKLDYTPICFLGYMIGWYFEPTARLLVMVASEDSKLFIYEDTALLWSCELLHPPIAVSRCFLKGLSGGLVTLSTGGVVNVSYVGTEPDLNGVGQTSFNEPSDPETIQRDLEATEDVLQNILDSGKDAEINPALEDLVKISIKVGKPVQNLYPESVYIGDAALHLLMSPVIIKLTFDDSASVQTLQISYICAPPFSSSDSTISLDSVKGIEIIETNIFVSSDLDITNTLLEVMFTITNQNGKLFILSKTVSLPIDLYCIPEESNNDNEATLVLEANTPCIDLMELYSEFTKEDLFEPNCKSSNISLTYRTSKRSVHISANDKAYSINSKDFIDILPALESLTYKLQEYYTASSTKFEFQVKLNKDVKNMLIHNFIKCVEKHAKAKIKLKEYEDQLGNLQRQFTLIQKKLLVQYGSLPPGDCDPLEFLMTDTFRRIQDTTLEIILVRESVCRAGASLVAVGNLIIYILRSASQDQFKVKLIEEMLTLHSLYDDFQEWEEAVSQSVSYILKNVFTKSEKEKAKLAPVTEQGILSHINLKRFLKQLRLILDRMFSDVLEDEQIASNSGQPSAVLRVEEMVAVI